MSNDRILEALKELEDNLQYASKINEEVSKASVGWHIAHSTKVFSAICKNFANSTPDDYIKKFNSNRFKIKLIRHIPRGIGKAPKSVATEEIPTSEEIANYIAKCKESYAQILKLSGNHYSEHPHFGHLNKRNTKWFLHLHTLHHLKIIREIVAK